VYVPISVAYVANLKKVLRESPGCTILAHSRFLTLLGHICPGLVDMENLPATTATTITTTPSQAKTPPAAPSKTPPLGRTPDARHDALLGAAPLSRKNLFGEEESEDSAEVERYLPGTLRPVLGGLANVMSSMEDLEMAWAIKASLGEIRAPPPPPAQKEVVEEPPFKFRFPAEDDDATLRSVLER